MLNKNNNDMKVGIVAIIGTILFIVGMVLGKGISISGKDTQLKIRVSNSGGIKVSSPLVVNGVKRGSVVAVDNVGNGVVITVSIDDIKDLREDATAKITILEITGGKKIEIFPGQSSNLYNPNIEMLGRNTADISDMISLLSDVSGDAVSLIRRLDTVSQAFTKVLEDGTAMQNLKLTLDGTSNLVLNTNTLLNKNYNNIDETLKNIKIITADLKVAIQKHEPNIDSLFTELKSTLKNIDNLIGKTDKTVINVDNLLLSINGITNDIKTNGSLVNRLLYDKHLSNDLDSTLKSLSTLVNSINNHGVNVNVRLGTRP
ncbi:MAG: MlaD family protein [Candidatus Kapabacteria bacterium]|nr:MlaD family protein [Candidatus Kapabacteria bacterium]